MDWLAGVSLTVGVFSIILAAVAIVVSLRTQRSTEKVLAEIDKRAAVIDETVKGTQEKLVDTMTELVKPQRATVEEQLLQQFMAGVFTNPGGVEQLKQLMEFGQEIEKAKSKTEEEKSDGN